ncbi:MAG: class I SAM-dependent methyltransferase [PS1 clade bacterium]|nr:class I SAM-dependent methyltransferase [PS1 clade bacterium]MBL6783774.1 class I SAM-dependent methyltransferase [PS1 clade bacterium]
MSRAEETKRDTRQDTETIDFGFREVARGDKQGLVRGVFDAVADKYDVMNDVMSGGLHRLWKARMIDALYMRPHSKLQLVDVAGGTGDIALRAHARAQKCGTLLDAHIIDANAEMMKAGRKRQAVQENMQQANNMHFTTGIAEQLPLPDGCADMLTIAFGIRNVTDRAAALKEAHRVLRPGGRFVCLEFSHLPSAVLQKLYDAYSFSIIPPMGALVAGERDAYQYLVESIRRFPTANAFLGEVEAAGFARAEAQLLSGGIAALHMGWRV